MKNFDSQELEILRGNLSAIGRSIPSSRSRTGYISRRYVYAVVTGKVTRENATTRAIYEKATKIVKALKS